MDGRQSWTSSSSYFNYYLHHLCVVSTEVFEEQFAGAKRPEMRLLMSQWGHLCSANSAAFYDFDCQILQRWCKRQSPDAKKEKVAKEFPQPRLIHPLKGASWLQDLIVNVAQFPWLLDHTWLKIFSQRLHCKLLTMSFLMTDSVTATSKGLLQITKIKRPSSLNSRHNDIQTQMDHQLY